MFKSIILATLICISIVIIALSWYPLTDNNQQPQTNQQPLVDSEYIEVVESFYLKHRSDDFTKQQHTTGVILVDKNTGDRYLYLYSPAGSTVIKLSRASPGQ